MFKNNFARKLYELAPDLLYTTTNGVWYAMYHKEKTILTNAGNSVSAFSYKTADEYKSVRKLIISKYNLKPIKIKYSVD